MTTSDSEDFESADEDIDFDSSKLKSGVQSNSGAPCSQDIKKNRELSECSTADSSKDVAENFSDAIGKSTSGNNDILCTQMDSKCAIKDSAISEDEKECYSNDTVEKISDMPSTLKETAKKKLEKRSERGRPRVAKESKVGPMKLGVRLSSKTTSVENKPSEASRSSHFNTDSSNPEEETESETAYTSSVELSHCSKPSSDSFVETEEEQPSSLSSGWGFGKGLIGAGGLGSLGGWGSSLLNTASLSVSTLGSHVTQGISTVFETVEAGIGAPSPEEMARHLKEEKEKNLRSEELGGKQSSEAKEGDDDNVGEIEMEAWGDWNDDDNGSAGYDSKGGGTGLLSLVSGVTQVTGKVFSTGLDTLEVIGKKTMEVLQEGDPGLKKKRALLLGETETVVLSQVLREAKEKAEAEAKLAEEKEAARKAHFETLFDDFQGLVHLEALEMLSRQSDMRLKGMLLKESGPALRGLQIRLAAVQEMCEVPDSDEVEDGPALLEAITEALNVLSVEVSAERLLQCVKDYHERVAEMKADVGDNGLSKAIPKVIHQEAITALATLTANAIEVFHKVTELLLVKEGKSREVKEEAKVLVGMTSALVSEVNKIATEFSDFLSTKLNDDSLTAVDKEKVESYITSTFLEASNSSTYIQDAFQLMVPVLQMGALA